MREESRHPIDLAFGCVLALISAIDFYTARSLSLVAYVEPHLVKVVQTLEVGVSIVCALGVATVIAAWPLLARPAHRRLMLAVLVLQTLGLTLDVAGLLASTLFGKHANPIYLLLEAALVHISTVLLFSAWYAAIDHHRQVARLRVPRTSDSVPAAFTGLTGRGGVPGFVDYLTSRSDVVEPGASGGVSAAKPPTVVPFSEPCSCPARPRRPRHRADRLSRQLAQQQAARRTA